MACHFLVLATILYTPLLPSEVVFALRFLLGFTAAGNVLAFAMAADLAPRHMRGAAIGALNTFGFIGITGAQVLPSLLLGPQSEPTVPSYVAVLTVLWAGLVLAGGLIAALREPEPAG